MNLVLTDFKHIRHFIFDIDGVLTNNQLLLASDGKLLRSMHIKDGYALQLAVKKGYRVSIISGGKGDNLMQRFVGLGLNEIHLGIDNKIEVFHSLSVDLPSSLYMGDDMPDLACMKMVFLPACPADACPEIQEIARYISPLKGGEGCARDVIEKVLKLNGDWQ